MNQIYMKIIDFIEVKFDYLIRSLVCVCLCEWIRGNVTIESTGSVTIQYNGMNDFQWIINADDVIHKTTNNMKWFWWSWSKCEWGEFNSIWTLDKRQHFLLFFAKFSQFEKHTVLINHFNANLLTFFSINQKNSSHFFRSVCHLKSFNFWFWNLA